MGLLKYWMGGCMFGLPKTSVEWLTTIFCLFITVVFIKIYLF
ncbi:hypothetical protein YPPY47_3090 [Yersinia pestis PY-47]|uniref:Uncharacterized protein n=1 Tax=Yersinia pestis biovar Orientalis str. IP275 TaxID=373665 RepID=A0AAV3BH06_YERPE|nr:hypothetical protein YPIP275_0962 [Yersinia pestis biovar Orientalis str. IP275]EDR45112.1 hypothetical protein YpE1979001_1627 [Yersinia pestis biovar Antiqua str. E1979001]EDR50821.1 hypothetical protein YpB42003004_0985 [Yersinia pestis biovar Antiqua str. B42003004]EDR55539.1 hypothetical protein YpMG051020_0239 [Yersinia pestis biovar Orientalis str. MG05-1020]EDR63457.1 hypothetical protein YpUG050454_1416 [Yersinia pestis biovar Antiqua str. UG05-0454]EDR67187.1 hypothetical protein 